MRPEPRAGFTLLEVLAAVALLGVLYTTLAGVAIQGLRSEGENERRMRASLLADRLLSNVEAEADAGLVPEVGVSEGEEEEFGIRMEIEPVTMASLLQTEPEEAASDEQPALRVIHVVVTWMEGVDELSVQRTTYAYDPEVLASRAPTPAGAGP